MKDSTIYDVVVIGGGLAGLSAAIQLGRKNYKVLVLEKDDYPRHKVCGEYVSLESKPFLESLGLQLSAMQLPYINRLQITDTHGHSLDTSLPQGGVGISRYKMDYELAQLAIAAGATLLTKTKADEVKEVNGNYQITAGSNTFQAKVVCGTWGKRSNMDVKWNRQFINEEKQSLNNYLAVKYHIRYPWPEDLIALHNFEDGYCGVSRVEDDKCCICYLTTAASLKKANNNLKDLEQQVIMRNPALHDIFSKAEFLYEQPLAISRISFQEKEQVCNDVLMLGDAAGLITPLCGNGMSMALHASKIGCKEIDAYLQQKISMQTMRSNYKKMWKQQFSFRLATGRFLQSRFGKERSTSIFLKVMKALPFLQRPLIRATAGTPF